MKDYWIFPSNVKYFDIINYLNENRTIVWRRTASIHKGDIVYFYLAAPYAEIKYRGIVVDDDVAEEVIEKNSYAIPKNGNKKAKYVQIEIEFEYPSGVLTREELVKHGLGQVQVQARIDRRLKPFISDVNMKLGIQEEE